jgi:hypothetical protein
MMWYRVGGSAVAKEGKLSPWLGEEPYGTGLCTISRLIKPGNERLNPLDLSLARRAVLY